MQSTVLNGYISLSSYCRPQITSLHVFYAMYLIQMRHIYIHDNKYRIIYMPTHSVCEHTWLVVPGQSSVHHAVRLVICVQSSPSVCSFGHACMAFHLPLVSCIHSVVRSCMFAFVSSCVCVIVCLCLISCACAMQQVAHSFVHTQLCSFGLAICSSSQYTVETVHTNYSHPCVALLPSHHAIYSCRSVDCWDCTYQMPSPLSTCHTIRLVVGV